MEIVSKLFFTLSKDFILKRAFFLLIKIVYSFLERIMSLKQKATYLKGKGLDNGVKTCPYKRHNKREDELKHKIRKYCPFLRRGTFVLRLLIKFSLFVLIFRVHCKPKRESQAL